ncbi:hit domain-containing, partial [Cystoisospora suis]
PPPPLSWIKHSPSSCFKNFSTASSFPLFPSISPSTHRPLLQTSDGEQPQVLLSSSSFLSFPSLSRSTSSFSPLLRSSLLSSPRNTAQRSAQADWLSKTSRRTMATEKTDNKGPIVPYDPENVFKKIIEGKIPCHKIFETEHVIAILDAFPAVEGHSLLIPKKEVSSIFELDEQTAANVYKELPRLCKAVQKATGCDGINVLQNNGRAAGQVVFHAHMHIVPRFQDDKLFKQFASSKDMISSEDAKNILTKIQANL